MMDQITFSAADGESRRCSIEVRYATRDQPNITVILTESGPPPISRLAEAIESVATMIYHRHLSFVAPDQVRWIERGADASGEGETAYEIGLTWIDDSLFETAGYRRPHWQRLPQRNVATGSSSRESRVSQQRDVAL